MTPLLENAELVTDLYCNFYNLLNVGELSPPPPGVVTDTDPRLTDARNPLPGSVTDISVAANAAIQQAKLDLNGLIPTLWLGHRPDQAAPGDLAEYIAFKGVPNGYAELDATGHLPANEAPVGAGVGTITTIGLSMPPEFVVTGSPVATNGVIQLSWASIPSGAWFGTGGTPGDPPVFFPVFSTSPIPAHLVPDLDASKIVSGVFNAQLLPIAIGVGPSNAPGAVPDPGATGNGLDYLGRDMLYHPVPSFGPGYQPVVPRPVLAISTGPPPYTVSITSGLVGSSMFYAINSDTGGFVPVPNTGLAVIQSGQTLYCYAAMAGYTNSPMAFISAPYAPPNEVVVTGDPLNPNDPVLGDDGLDVTVGGGGVPSPT